MTIKYVIGTTVQFDIPRGDSYSFRVTWQDSNGNPVNITGYTLALLDSDDAAISATVTASSPSNGQILVSFTTTQTSAMDDQYFRLRAGNGVTNQTTLLEGRLNMV